MKKIAFVLICSFLANQAAFAGPAPAPSPTPAPFHVNPNTLRTTLLYGNYAILVGMNQVAQAKDQVKVARANLLPSVSLSVIFSPNFLLGSVSLLLPFLFPSNWFNKAQSKNTLAADTVAYYLVQLNQYASAYALYEEMVSDVDLNIALKQQSVALQNLYASLKQQNQVGKTSDQDLNSAAGRSELADIDLSQSDKLLATETAALRQMLAVPLEQQLILDVAHVPASTYENSTPQILSAKALSVAPENSQIDDLVAASYDTKWSKFWSFFTSASLGTIGSNSSGGQISGANFGHVGESNSGTFGFATFANLQLSNDSIEQLQLQKVELKEETDQLAETALTSIVQSQKQLLLAQAAEQNLINAYNIELENFYLGTTDLLHVLDANTAILAATEARVNSQIDLDNLRINIHRMLITDQFALIQGCQLQDYNGNETLDDACNPNYNSDNDPNVP